MEWRDVLRVGLLALHKVVMLSLDRVPRDRNNRGLVLRRLVSRLRRLFLGGPGTRGLEVPERPRRRPERDGQAALAEQDEKVDSGRLTLRYT